MPKLPVISGREAVKALIAAGFEVQPRRGKGSHIVVARRDPTIIITIPDHKELDRGTLRAIIRQAGLDPSRFIELLRG